jgi:hypothetical protein
MWDSGQWAVGSGQDRMAYSQSAADISTQRADRLHVAGVARRAARTSELRAVVPGTVQGTVGKAFLRPEETCQTDAQLSEANGPRFQRCKSSTQRCAALRPRLRFLDVPVGGARTHAVVAPLCATPGLQQATCSRPQHLTAKKHRLSPRLMPR